MGNKKVTSLTFGCVCVCVRFLLAMDIQAYKCAGLSGNFAQSWEEKERLIQSV